MSRIIEIKSKQVQQQKLEDSIEQNSQIGINKGFDLTNNTSALQFVKQKSISNVIQTNQGAQCRICLQNQSESNQKLIQPCQCTGSVQSVHEGCFTQWISRSLSTKTNRQLAKIAKDGIQCDLCKMKFEIKFNFQKVCTNKQKLKQKIKRRMCEFSTLMSMLIMSLILAAVALALLPANPFDINLNRNQEAQKQLPQGLPPGTVVVIQDNSSDDWLKITLLGSLSLLVIILGFVFYLLLIEYGFTYRTEFGYKGKHKKTIKGIVIQTE